jgi:hypothetical protein
MSGSDGEGFSDGKFGEEIMLKSACCRFMAAIIPACFLSIAMLITAVHHNVAQAKSRTAGAAACGKELKKQCSGVEVKANNMLECLQTSQVSAMLCVAVIETQRSFAKASSRVEATFLDV